MSLSMLEMSPPQFLCLMKRLCFTGTQRILGDESSKRIYLDGHVILGALFPVHHNSPVSFINDLPFSLVTRYVIIIAWLVGICMSP